MITIIIERTSKPHSILAVIDTGEHEIELNSIERINGVLNLPNFNGRKALVTVYENEQCVADNAIMTLPLHLTR